MDQPTSPAHPLRIFVVENHPDTLKYLCLYLEMLGHTACAARNLTEALAAWPEAHCAVLISDIGLPDGDGFELLQRLGSPRPVYAIAMSGFGSNSDRARSRAAGYRHHLLKPFEPDDLDPMLAEAAQLAQAAPN